MTEFSPDQNDQKIRNGVYAISLFLLLVGLVLLAKVYFFPGQKKEFVNSCSRIESSQTNNQVQNSVDISRINQLKIDICENIVWENKISSERSWTWNLIFICLPVVSTVILAIAKNPVLKSLFVAITSISTVFISQTAVDKWYAFQNRLATEGRSLVFSLNYEVDTKEKFENVVKDYKKLILRSSTDQPLNKVQPSSTDQPFISPSPKDDSVIPGLGEETP